MQIIVSNTNLKSKQESQHRKSLKKISILQQDVKFNKNSLKI
jgi:hypothetical protein